MRKYLVLLILVMYSFLNVPAASAQESSTNFRDYQGNYDYTAGFEEEITNDVLVEFEGMAGEEKADFLATYYNEHSASNTFSDKYAGDYIETTNDNYFVNYDGFPFRVLDQLSDNVFIMESEETLFTNLRQMRSYPIYYVYFTEGDLVLFLVYETHNAVQDLTLEYLVFSNN